MLANYTQLFLIYKDNSCTASWPLFPKRIYRKGIIRCSFRRGKATKMSAFAEFPDLVSENGIYASTNGMIRNVFPGEMENYLKKTL